LASDERLLDRLDAPLLDFTTAVFGLHADWLRRSDADQVLPARNLDKSRRKLSGLPPGTERGPLGGETGSGIPVPAGSTVT
jgi:hypothetical protein